MNTRLYRITLAGALLLVLGVSFTVSRPEVLPQPPPPAFDGVSAAALANELATRFPDRGPGTPGADRAADWVEQQLEGFGYTVRRDRFRATIPGQGPTELQNLVAVRRGRTGRAIVVVAHRDDVGLGPGANANASGTGALLELARLYGSAPSTAGGASLDPTHTLLFVSTDGGAFGSLGADRYASRTGVKERRARRRQPGCDRRTRAGAARRRRAAQPDLRRPRSSPPPAPGSRSSRAASRATPG